LSARPHQKRDVLPIPDVAHVGLTTYDAKDPRNAAVALVRLLAEYCALPIPAAVTLASVAADLEIAQLVNDPFPTVTCSLAIDVLEGRSDLPPSMTSTG
jgi:acetamidase/formamidase